MNPSTRKPPPGWLKLALLILIVGSTHLRAADDPPIDDRIMFDGVKVNGQPVRMAFDTGSEVIALFRPVAERLGLKITEPPADAEISPGQTRIGRTDPVEFQFVTQTVTDRLAVVDVPAGTRPDVDGVVGWGAFREIFSTFDAERSNVNFAATGKTPEPAAAWQAVPLRKDSRMLVLDIGGSRNPPGAILIDTGHAGGVKLAPARWREWRAAHPNAPTTMNAYVTPGIGLVVSEVSWAKELTIGPLILTDVTVEEASPLEAAAFPGYAATLGLTVIKRQDVVIDGKNGMAYFARRQLPSLPTQHNRLGAVFTPIDLQHDPLEAHAAVGSPAEAAGIRNGDLLLKIDTLDATKWRTDPAVMPMGKFWSRPAGTKFVLTLKRGDKEMTATVTLRDILGPGTAPPTPPPKP